MPTSSGNPRFDDLSEVGLLLEEFELESDRGVGLISAAFLDGLLASMLEALLVDDRQIVERLLGDYGALGSSSARADLAYCLGLLSRDEWHDLGVIRKIRNRFAHEHSGLSFDDSRIADQCRALKVSSEVLASLSPATPDTMSPRELFTTEVASLVGAMIRRRRGVNRLLPIELDEQNGGTRK